jgi:hypothetical protein
MKTKLLAALCGLVLACAVQAQALNYDVPINTKNSP